MADGEDYPFAGETVTTKALPGKKRISVIALSQDTDTNGKTLFVIIATKRTGNVKVNFKTATSITLYKDLYTSKCHYEKWKVKTSVCLPKGLREQSV